MSTESGSPSEVGDPEYTDENILKILVASDINLGYEQSIKKDHENDSFRTFKEILQYAENYEVDAILLAGNLFYEATPSLNVITECVSLLRKYCLGQKPSKTDCVTDPDWIFRHCHHKIANFKDPNLNIKIPVFSICGHRDNPTFDSAGSLDLLAASGLVNYFGKWPINDTLSIPPALIQKGITATALYGLNHMNDKKLSILIKNKKFEILKDSEISDVCNVLVLHQNRARPNRNDDMCLSEALLPNFFDLIIWGHEPACRITPESCSNKRFFISQPGSTIATSLNRGEAVQKHVAILKIYKSEMKVQKVKLKTVRPFVYDRINLSEYENEITSLQTDNPLGRLTRTEAVEYFIDKCIEKVLLPDAQKKETGHPQQPRKPLLRLKILCNLNKDQFDPTRKLLKKYRNKVSNPENMIFFINHTAECDSEIDDDDDCEELSTIFCKNETQNWNRSIEGEILDHFDQAENKNKLNVLTLPRLNKALEEFKNNDKRAFERVVREQMQDVLNHLVDKDVELEDALKAIESYRNV